MKGSQVTDVKGWVSVSVWGQGKYGWFSMGVGGQGEGVRGWVFVSESRVNGSGNGCL